MVYQAKVLFLSLLLIGSWRLVVKNSNFVDWFELPSWLQGMGLPKKLPQWLKQPLHYYVILYFMLGVLLFNSLHDTVKIMRKTDFMDVWAFHLPDSVPEEERSFPRWLFSVSAYTPLASIATFVVSVGHTLVHYCAIRGIELQRVVDQDRAILVIALPAVYGPSSWMRTTPTTIPRISTKPTRCTFSRSFACRKLRRELRTRAPPPSHRRSKL